MATHSVVDCTMKEDSGGHRVDLVLESRDVCNIYLGRDWIQATRLHQAMLARLRASEHHKIQVDVNRASELLGANDDQPA